MITTNITTVIQVDIHSVWNLVFDVKNYIWRNDLIKTEIVNEEQFIEYAKGGYPTTFTTTVIEPYQRWEFDIDNTNINGHWIGIFTKHREGTKLDFTEQVVVKKFYLKPFIKFYLKKQQARFIADLKRALI